MPSQELGPPPDYLSNDGFTKLHTPPVSSDVSATPTIASRKSVHIVEPRGSSDESSSTSLDDLENGLGGRALSGRSDSTSNPYSNLGGDAPSVVASSVSKTAMEFMRATSKLAADEAPINHTSDPQGVHIPEVLIFMKRKPWTFLPVVLAAFGGLCNVYYGACNREMKTVLGCGMWAPTTAYGVAMIITNLFHWTKREPALKPLIKEFVSDIKEDGALWISLLGGIIGCAYGALSTYIPSALGLGPYYTFLIVGQVLSSMLVDGTGLLWVRKIHLTWVVYSGAIIVIIGALVYEFKGFLNMGDENPWTMAGCILGAVTGGWCSVSQSAINGELSRHIGATRRAQAWNYATGTIIFGIPMSLILDQHPNYSPFPWATSWWAWLGGLGSLGSGVCVLLSPLFLGYAHAYCWVIASQLTFSLIFDNFGWFHGTIYPADAYRICGVFILMAGVLVIQVGKLHAAKKAARNTAAGGAATFESFDSEIYVCEKESLKPVLSSAIDIGDADTDVGDSPVRRSLSDQAAPTMTTATAQLPTGANGSREDSLTNARILHAAHKEPHHHHTGGMPNQFVPAGL